MDKKDEFPLFKIFPKLKKIPRISIINIPTPVEQMIRTGKILGDSNVWIKRDDLTHEQYGGNKPRKYEFVFADALKKKKTRLLTMGGIGTNHGLATTIHSKDLGFETHLYLNDQPLSQHVRENLLCHHYFGAKLHLVKNENERNRKMRFKNFIDRKSYFIITGASSPLGTLGFVNAGLELAEQVEQGKIPEPDKIFIAAGSLATCAGLILGLELARLKTRIIGINITSSNEYIKERTLNLARNALEIMRKYDPDIPNISSRIDSRLTIKYGYSGGKYGKATKEALEAIVIAEQDGYKLEYVYTGKTLSALVDYCRNNPKAKEEVLLFWNTKSSVDLSDIYNNYNFRKLPSEFHKYFDGTIKLDNNF